MAEHEIEPAQEAPAHDAATDGQDAATWDGGLHEDPVAYDETAEHAPGSGGRWLSILGALVAVGALFLTWYQVTRANGYTENTTGWQTFSHLRWGVLVGAVAALATAVVVQTQRLVILRTLIGAAITALVLRRIVSPPSLSGATVTSQLGVYIALLGALALAFGGLLGLGAGAAFDEEDALPADAPAGELGPGAAAEPPSAADDEARLEEPEVVEAQVVEDPERA